MRTLIAALMFTALPLAPALAEETAPETTATRLAVTVANVTPGKGTVNVAAFDEAGWLGTSLKGAKASADSDSVTVLLELPEGGTYGVAVYQDLDENNQLKRGFMGLPAEPYAFSNNAPIRFGPPKWDDAKIEVAEGETRATSVTLKD